MERKTADDFDPELLDLFDQYVHGGVDRRQFLERASRFAVGGMTAAALLESLSPHYAWAEQVPKDDKRLQTEYVTYASPKGHGKIKGYLARPREGAGKLPAVLVVHENRGLNPYIEDVVRRLAVANFLAFAPDALTPVGRLPRQRRQGPRAAGHPRPRQDPRRHGRRRRLRARPCALERQARRRRLLLRRVRVELAGRAHAGPGGGGAVLRRPAAGGRRAEDQGLAAAPLRRPTTSA